MSRSKADQRRPTVWSSSRRKVCNRLYAADSRCRYCLREMTRDEVTVDHIVPRSKGGADRMPNLTLACDDCQQKKGDEMPGTKWIPKDLTIRCANCCADCGSEPRIVFGHDCCSPGCAAAILAEIAEEETLTRELEYEPREDFAPCGSWFEEALP